MRRMCLPLLVLFVLTSDGLFAQVKKPGNSRQAGTGNKSSIKISAAPSATGNKTANTNVVIDPDGGGGGGGGCNASAWITNPSGSGAVCQGENSTTLLATTVSPGALQWLSSSDNHNYFPIPNANGTSYTATNLSQTTYFRLAVTDNICTGYSNEIVIGISPPPDWYKDLDGDGYSDGASLAQCSRPANYKLASELNTTSGDCDDNNPDVWNGGYYYIDKDGDQYTSGTEFLCFGASFPTGYSTISKGDDCDDNNSLLWFSITAYVDKDGDGYDNGLGSACFGLSGAISPGFSLGTNGSDCNDNDQAVHGSSVFYRDNDEDGYGDAETSITDCSRPSGFVANNSDCDDNDRTIYPGAPELCDGKDNNCNNQSDEGASIITYYRDEDGDGFGNASTSTQGCSKPQGYVTNDADCDDSKSTIYPGAPELCDGVDNNCNDQIDEGVTLINYYRDADGDGYGSAALTKQSCSKPEGYVANDTDCNDSNDAIYPGASELCDGKDNNCNNQTDEGSTTYYRDADGDGYGNPAIITQSCTKPAGYVTNNGDCNDSKQKVNPNAPEICNGIDDNCNGLVDELSITNLTTTKITTSSAKLNWSSSSSPTGFQVSYQKSGSTTWQTILVSGSSRSVSLNSLSRNQAYNWRIRALCGNYLTTYTAIATFRTLLSGGTRGKPATADQNDIMEIAGKLHIRAWPNPSRRDFTIAVEPNHQTAYVKMIVADLYGRLVEERILKNEQPIRLGDNYQPGVYLVKLIRGDQVEQLKLIKLE